MCDCVVCFEGLVGWEMFWFGVVMVFGVVVYEEFDVWFVVFGVEVCVVCCVFVVECWCVG